MTFPKVWKCFFFFHENEDVMDNSTKLYSIVNITVNDVADRKNKSNNFFHLRHYKNRHKCVID